LKKLQKVVSHSEIYGISLGIIGYICYAFSAVFAKLAVNVNTSMLYFLRNIMLFAFILPFLGIKKLPLKTQKFHFYLIRGLSAFIAVYLFYYIVKKLSLVDSTLLINTYPLFIPLIALIWFRKKIPLRRILLLLVGFVGVIFILKPKWDFFNTSGFLGVLAGLFLALAVASIRKLARTEHAGTMMFYQSLILLLASIFPALVFWQTVSDPLMWLYIFLVGIFAFAFQYLIIKAYTYAPVSKVSATGYFMVIMGGVFDYFIWNTILDIWDLIGVLLVIISGLFIVLDKKQSTPIRKKIKD